MGCIQLNQKLVARLKIGLTVNSFEKKAVRFCEHAAHVVRCCQVLHKIVHCKKIERPSNLWGVITAKIKFGILLCCFPMRFLIIPLVLFDVLNDVRQNVAVVLLFLYSIIPNLDAIIRVRMLLCETSMLLFVSVCCYAKPRCYYSCFELCTSSESSTATVWREW